MSLLSRTLVLVVYQFAYDNIAFLHEMSPIFWLKFAIIQNKFIVCIISLLQVVASEKNNEFEISRKYYKIINHSFHSKLML